MATINVILGDNGQGKTRYLLNFFNENFKDNHFAILSNSLINPFPRVEENSPHYYRLRSRNGFNSDFLSRSISDYFVNLIRNNSLRRLLSICKMIGYSDDIVVRREPLYGITRTNENYNPYELIYSAYGKNRYKSTTSFKRPITNGMVKEYGNYLGMSRDFHLGYNDYENMSQSLNDHLSQEDELKANLGIGSFRPLFENRVFVRKSGDFFPIEHASSGELYMLSSGLFLNKFLDDREIKLPKVILIDEPENSLHPKWQRKYIEFLVSFMDYNDKTKVIIATHSPFITMETNFLSSEVSLFHIEDGVIYKANHKNKNNNIEQVYYELFGVLTPKNRYLSDYCSKLVRDVAEGKEYYSDAYEKISAMKKAAFDNKQSIFLADVLKLLSKVHGDLNG